MVLCLPCVECDRLLFNGGALRLRRRLHFRGRRWVDRNRHHANANGIGAPTTCDVLQENIESDPRRAVKFSIHAKIALRGECWQLDKSGRGDGHYREVGTLLANRPEALLEALGRIETLRIRRRKVTQNRIIPREIGVIYCEKDVAHEGNKLFCTWKRWRIRDRSDPHRRSCRGSLRWC